MFKHRLPFRRPTPSMAVAVTALVVASSGTSYAAVSLSGKDLKRGSVPADRIKSNSLTGKQINESKLKRVGSAVTAKRADHAKQADAAGTAQSAVTAQSATTAGNAAQAANAATLQGKSPAAFMASGTRLVTDQTVDLSGAGAGEGITVQVTCDASEHAISGGGGWYVPGTDVHTSLNAPVTASTPLVEGGKITGWQVSGRNLSGSDRFMRVYALCVPTTP